MVRGNRTTVVVLTISAPSHRASGRRRAAVGQFAAKAAWCGPARKCSGSADPGTPPAVAYRLTAEAGEPAPALLAVEPVT